MILYIALGVVVALSTFIALGEYGFWEKLGAFIVVNIFGCIAAGLLVMLASLALTPFNSTSSGPTETYELQAISAGSKSQGSFFLGTGYVDETLSYSYYKKNDDGSFSAESLPADWVRVVESDGTPKLEKYSEYSPTWLLPSWVGEMDYNYVITVPKGSVAPNVDMSLPK